MSTEIIEVIGRFIEERPGVFHWEGVEPSPAVHLWRPAGRYHLLDGTIADAPRITVRSTTSDEEIVGASAIGAALVYEGFMAAWQGLTMEQRRELGRQAGEAACRTWATLTRRTEQPALTLAGPCPGGPEPQDR